MRKTAYCHTIFAFLEDARNSFSMTNPTGTATSPAESFDIINLNNNTAMMPKEQQDKYHYFYEKLQTNNFVVQLFGPARFTPKEN